MASQELDFGCDHYQRNCKLVAACCGKKYYCRFCHDANEEKDHAIDRFKTKSMECCYCKTIQAVSQYCQYCDHRMARYYCNICKFWDDSERNVFHCKDCGICRVGNASDFQHCTQCGICISITDIHQHTHFNFQQQSQPQRSISTSRGRVSTNLSAKCRVCNEDFFKSRKVAQILKCCGNVIHFECENLDQAQFICPFCTHANANDNQENINTNNQASDELNSMLYSFGTLTMEDGTRESNGENQSRSDNFESETKSCATTYVSF